MAQPPIPRSANSRRTAASRKAVFASGMSPVGRLPPVYGTLPRKSRPALRNEKSLGRAFLSGALAALLRLLPAKLLLGRLDLFHLFRLDLFFLYFFLLH